MKDKDEKTITYVQFASGLNVIAATRFPEVTSVAIELFWLEGENRQTRVYDGQQRAIYRIHQAAVVL